VARDLEEPGFSRDTPEKRQIDHTAEICKNDKNSCIKQKAEVEKQSTTCKPTEEMGESERMNLTE
jgi:hypothetical protein